MKFIKAFIIGIVVMSMAGCPGWTWNTEDEPTEPIQGVSETNTDPLNINMPQLNNSLLNVGTHNEVLSTPWGALELRYGGYLDDTRYVNTDTRPPAVFMSIIGAKPCTTNSEGDMVCTGHWVGFVAFVGCLDNPNDGLGVQCDTDDQGNDLGMVSPDYTAVFLVYGKIDEDLDNPGQYILTAYFATNRNPAQGRLFADEGRVFIRWEFADGNYPDGTDAPNPAGITDHLLDIPFETEFFDPVAMGTAGVGAGTLGTFSCGLGDDLKSYSSPDSFDFAGNQIADYTICP